MDEIDNLLNRRVDNIYPSREELEKILRSGKKLRLYQGFDPSSPVLHIGHLTGLKKLADFQKLGHEVIFLIGDFTGMIGDPTGKKEGRKKMTHENVLANAKEYENQAGRVLKFKQTDCSPHEKPVKIMFNYDWNSKLSFEDVLRLASNITAQNLWERDMFQERVKKGEEIWFHELMYPLIQGFDSVAMDVDLEIGGSDQMFNMMVGRELMKKMKNKNKFVLTTPLLIDKEGKKIGKTEGNAIALTDSPEKLFAGVMTLPDEAIIPAFKLITDEVLEKILDYERKIKAGENPMIYKKLLAQKVVAELNSEEAAETAKRAFESVVQKGEAPKEMLEISIMNNTSLEDLIVSQGESHRQAKRLIQQGAVEINGRKSLNPQLIVGLNSIVKIGKKKFIKTK